MQETQPDSVTQKFQTIFLVVVESLLTVLLRFDNNLRQKVYPLVTADSLIAIRSYLPHDEVYLTFTLKGVLLDSKKPDHKQRPDVIINAHSFQIINAIISDKSKAVDQLQFRGEPEQVELFKSFLQELSLNSVVAKLLSRFRKQQEQESEESDTKKSKTDYKVKFTELKSVHQQLEIENARLATEVAELKSRENVFTILAVVGLVVGFLIGWLAL